MKVNHLLIWICLVCTSPSQAQEQYQIIINGEPYDISLDKSFTYITDSGEQVEFQVNKSGFPIVSQPEPEDKSKRQAKSKKSNSSGQYSGELVSFSYPEGYGVAETEPIQGLNQVTMLSGDGGGIIVQEFLSIEAPNLVPQLLEGIVGSKQMANSKVVQQQISGKKVSGLHALDDLGNQVVVYAYAHKNKSLFITLVGKDGQREEFSRFLTDIEINF